METWEAIEALPGLLEAWDPERNTTAGTGVSDIQGVVAGITLSNAVGSEQPTEVTGPWPSGTKGLQFLLASAQHLFVTGSNVVTTAANDEDVVIYTAGRLDSNTINRRSVCLGNAAGGLNYFALRNFVSGSTRYDSIGDAGSFIKSFGTSNVDTDEWVYIEQDGTDTSGRIRGQSATLNADFQTFSTIDTIAWGCLFDGADSDHVDATFAGLFAFKASEVNHAATQAALDDLMGL